MPALKGMIDKLATLKIHHKAIDAIFDKEDSSRESLDAVFKDRAEKFKQGLHGKRLKTIRAAPLEHQAGFIPPSFPKTASEEKFLNDLLETGFVFSHLSAKERRALLGAFEPCAAGKGEVIIRQGDAGDFFYIIQRGTISFSVDGEVVGNASSGQAFGELALLYDCPRAATCIADTDSDLWRVDQKTFRMILASYSIENDNETKELLKKVPFLRTLDDSALTKVASALITANYDKGEKIIEKGDEAKKFCIIIEGKVKIQDIEVDGGRKYDNLVLGPGEWFGEAAITSDKSIMATVTVLEDVKMLTLDKENFTRLVGNFSDLIQWSSDIKKLMAIQSFGKKAQLQSHEADSLASMVVDADYKQGHIFFKEGEDAPPCLFLVRSGSVLIEYKVNKSDNKTLIEGGFFGEDTLNKDYWVDERAFLSYTATAADDCRVGALTLEAIKSVLVERDVKKNIGLDDLEKFSLLGAGSFGKVWLVSVSGSRDETYALKVQNKRKLIESGVVSDVIHERDIMAQLDHPFIVKLANSYQDERSVYMLEKLYQGGEMRSLMWSMRYHSMPEWAARFYAADILLGLSHMHNRKILMRDLKPENVMLDSDGYAVIIDLGFAKVVPNRTYTFCGTPMYIAPEVILQRGYDKGADLWSWAVMLYEMIVGIPPFYDDPDMDQRTLFERIINGVYVFPEGNFMSDSAKDLLRRLLVVRPRDRLGGLNGGKISNHEWFAEVNWKRMTGKEIKAPWTPRVKDPFDATNFQPGEVEDEDPDEIPLTAKEQKLFKDF